ncbi:ABC transporter substrate-binding protein [Dyadobacter fanqingshengii]|uniref:ABC transporter substrate-binding protein n=1 Tax=Dyadobacter fanqingshengii TaxID=2906443 RepID=A0A9X1TA46_9BACT|nr:ABC transporter substrate-binding protein [Dyadobacter fanqingshengii]MCF0042110.1 ABC transporter substrate-binding protein [Dyadobacter fanqingshengii]USJ35354.1 ABC transporter substrate-binding protein [Dyadobacter fanqingshengii]
MTNQRSFKNSTFLFLFLFSFLHLSGCNSEKKQSKEESSKVEKNTYADQTKINHAKGFTITYHSNYKIVSILSPFETGTDTSKYILLERGTARPTGLEEAQVIEIPLRSIVATSSMHVALLEFLDSESIIIGLSNPQYIYSAKVQAMIKAGKVVNIGRDQGLNEEKLLEMHPDVVMAMGGPGAKVDHYRILAQAGIPVLINSEWIEKTPLARAEWVKLVAALLNKEKEVNEKFAKIEAEYARLAELVKEVKEKPSIISGLNTKDAWFLPNGDSYMSQFFRDAGGDYHWSKTKAAGSLPLNFESVYPIALEADAWLNVGFDKSDTKANILAQDSRYSDFKAYKSGRMYSYCGRVNDQGANDFFESGTVNPHIVLSDLIKILHPELLPEHHLVYYKQLK